MTITGKIFMLVLLATSLTFAVAETSFAQSNDWRLVPNQRAGPIRATTDEASLIRLFGRPNVKRMPYRLAALPVLTVTAVYPNDPTRRIIVVWKEGQLGKVAGMVIVDGKHSRWSLENGVTIGTSMAALEKLNGGPFHLNGFDWDNGGEASWPNGRLQQALADVYVSMGNGNWSVLSEAEKSSLVGERDLSTTLPALRKLAPQVERLLVGLGR